MHRSATRQGSLNEQKGDADAASWLPPNKSYRCAYVARQVAIKIKYRLWMTTAENQTISRILDGCGNEPLPAIGSQLTPAARSTTPAPTSQPRVASPPTTSKPAPPVQPTTAAPPPTDVYYANCAAVRAAGKAPLHTGDPGYRSGLDRDSDGVACEN
ncbi:excalibur calcium-binding domain-containing protein [Jatrophihabitans sp. DSM 45814]